MTALKSPQVYHRDRLGLIGPEIWIRLPALCGNISRLNFLDNNTCTYVPLQEELAWDIPETGVSGSDRAGYIPSCRVSAWALAQTISVLATKLTIFEERILSRELNRWKSGSGK